MSSNQTVRLGMIALATILPFAGGCFTTRIHAGPATAQSPSTLYQDRWHHTLVGGLAEISDPVDLEAACPQGEWAAILDEVTFVNGLVSVVVGIYTPRTYTIQCHGGAASAVNP